jgi:hypothetical protein
MPDTAAQLVGPQVFPDILDRVQFGRIRRKVQQGDIVSYLKLSAGLMPSGAVQDQHGVRAIRHLRVDFLEMFIHGFGIDRWHDDGGAHTTIRGRWRQRYGWYHDGCPAPSRVVN